MTRHDDSMGKCRRSRAASLGRDRNARQRMERRMSTTMEEDLGLIFEDADVPLDLQAEARRIALTYRMMVDWSPELGFTALCVELPRLTARAASIDACTESLFEQAAEHVAGRLIQG